jgi:hypothetical protein
MEVNYESTDGDTNTYVESHLFPVEPGKPQGFGAGILPTVFTQRTKGSAEG